MKKISNPVVFFGSGPVAAASLALLREHCEIEAVITKPKPAHHKEAFPVLEVADQFGLPVHTVSTKQELSKLMESHSFKSSVGVLIDFGIIVSQDVIDYFPRGIVNSHFSLLPEWRGADPITFAILSGQASTGVSLMLLVEAMDEGPLLAYGEYELPQDITEPQLTQHLIQLSDAMLRAELPRYLANIDFIAAPQSVTGRAVSYSRKFTKADGLIDWSKPAATLEREVRAFITWPRSRTTIAGKEVAITQAHVGDNQSKAKPGDIIVEGKDQIGVATADGVLWVDRMQPASKKEMTAEAFINGHRELLSKAS